MEGMRQLDEFNRIRPELPQPDQALGLASPLTPPLKELKENDLDILQLVINYGQMRAILDRSPKTDLETAQALLNLINKGYVAAN